MKNNKKNAITVGIVLASTAMGGCATQQIDNSKEIARDKLEEVKLLKKQAETVTRTSSAVDVVDEFYIVAKPYDMSERERLPEFFQERVIFTQLNPVTVQELTGLIAQKVNTRIEFTADAMDFLGQAEFSGAAKGSGDEESEESESGEADVSTEVDFGGTKVHASQQEFSVKYNGTLEGLLDHVTNKVGLYWKWEDQNVVVFRKELKHYVFDGVNSKTDFRSEVSAGGSAGDSAGGERSTSHSTTYETNFNSVYDELDKTLGTIVSASGEYSVSTNTGTITVYDTPLVQKRVDKFVQKMNAIMNKRVMIKTQVLEVRADDTGDYGIDWNAVYSGSSRLGFDLKSLASTGDVSGNLNFSLIDGGSNWNGSKAAISALNEVADTSLVTSSTSMTRNGQPVPVQIVDSKGYLKKLEKTEGEDGEGDSFTMETALIESGFSMSILPRITSDGKVAMQMAVDLSELNGFDKFEFSDNVAMTPDVSRKNFTQNVSVKSGQTLMLSGFERTVDESTVKSMAGESSWLAGGSKEGGQRKVMTIIMMTPYVMSN
ncbi:hypothetical protein [Vibrio owensii]|uniref:hypothetical protein n=1 Tax=Vibrio harveyi group TaxID=717610 RepID=UPI003CC52069